MAGGKQRRIRVYSEEEKDALRAQRDLPPEERVCPACGSRGVRSYYAMVSGRSRPTIASTAWCPACHTYTGSTGPALGRVIATDPVAADSNAPKDGPTQRAMDEYFSYLDRLWERGLLPQQVTRGSGGRAQR